MKTPHHHEPTEDEIRHEAYLLWLADGRPPGRELEHWHAARETLRHRVHVSALRALPDEGNVLHFPPARGTRRRS
jgi:hypothetical protein